MTTDKFLTVSQLNTHIKGALNATFPYPVWVCGEIQQYNRSRNKRHVFFELVEKDSKTHEVKARIGLVMFANQRLQIEQVLKCSANAFELKDDIEVKFACKIDFYVPHGAVRLVVEAIDPTYTLGKMAQQRQLIIAELKQAGALDRNKQRVLPLVPLKVGLITSGDSAAYNDFYAELKRSGYGFQIILRNTLMQGKQTPTDVCQGLKELQKIKGLDCVVITRGGGSVADLSWFDSREIALVIANYPLPVFSGIGHEIDTTITDMAVHTTAKTPTAIAQFIVQRVKSFIDSMDAYQESLIQGAQRRLGEARQQLNQEALGLQQGMQQFFKERHARLIRLAEAFKHKPLNVMQAAHQRMQQQVEALQRGIRNRLETEKQRVQHYDKMTTILHPRNTLKRGFSITRTADGKVLKRIHDLKQGQGIKTHLVDGVIESDVTKIMEEK